MNVGTIVFEFPSSELDRLADIETLELKDLQEKYPDIRDDFSTPLCQFGNMSVVLHHAIPGYYCDENEQRKPLHGTNCVELRRNGVTVDFDVVPFSALGEAKDSTLEYKVDGNEKQAVRVAFKRTYKNLFE